MRHCSSTKCARVYETPRPGLTNTFHMQRATIVVWSSASILGARSLPRHPTFCISDSYFPTTLCGDSAVSLLSATPSSCIARTWVSVSRPHPLWFRSFYTYFACVRCKRSSMSLMHTQVRVRPSRMCSQGYGWSHVAVSLCRSAALSKVTRYFLVFDSRHPTVCVICRLADSALAMYWCSSAARWCRWLMAARLNIGLIKFQHSAVRTLFPCRGAAHYPDEVSYLKRWAWGV